MRFICIILTSLLLPTLVDAQVKTVKWSGYYIGANYNIGALHYYHRNLHVFYDAYNFQKPYSKDFFEDKSLSDDYNHILSGPSFQFAIQPTKARNNHIQIELGVEKAYSQRTINGSFITPGDEDQFVDGILTENSYQLRAAGIYLFNSEKTSYRRPIVYYGMGPEVSYDVYSTISLDGRYRNANSNSTFYETRDVGTLKKSLDFYLHTKFGMETSLVKALHFNMEISYRHGMKNVIGYRTFEVGKTTFGAGLRLYFAKFGKIDRRPCPAFGPGKKR